jgi:hypothetical protein
MSFSKPLRVSKPIRLTDHELDAVFAAARPLAPECRDGFLREVANLLDACPEVGPGAIHRAICEAQSRFFDPPDLRAGVVQSRRYR